MSKRISEFASSIKQLGEIQVNDWDFDGLLHKDVREIEFAKSLRRLGSIRVMEWDFRTVLPAVSRLANQEVDVVGLLKSAAHYKVMEWDFRNPRSSDPESASCRKSAPSKERLKGEEMQALIMRLKDFLQYVVANLIDEPGHARIKVREIAPNVLRFKLVLVKRDASMLIGVEGHTASAIRNMLKTAAGQVGVAALLQILSHEEESAHADEGLPDE